MSMHRAPFNCKNPHRSTALGTVDLPQRPPLLPLGLRVLAVGGVAYSLEVGRGTWGVLMPYKPLTRVLLERSYHHQDYLLPTMKPLFKSADNVPSNSGSLGQLLRMVVLFLRSAAAYRSNDPRTIPAP